MLVQILIFAFAGLMLFAAWNDAMEFRIPNWIPAAVALLFPVAALAGGIGWGVFGFSLLAGFVALLLGMGLFAGGLLGGGDAKLFAAAALWFGWPAAATFMLYTVLVGGVLVLALVVLRRAAPLAGVPEGWTDNTALARGAPVPYGIALAGGALWSMPIAPLFLAI